VYLDPRRHLVHYVLRRMGRRDGRIQTVAEYVSAKQQNPDPHLPPIGRAARDLDISEGEVDGTLVYRVTPPGDARGAFVYLHGGSYISEITAAQWELVMELSRGSGSTCLVPICPLAPSETAEQLVPRAATVIAAAVEEFGAENLSVFADSAGGGLAVAAVQHLRNAGTALPARLVLLAPWLDVELRHPDQEALKSLDLMARPDYLLDAGRTYAGDLPTDDWRVSPLFGDFTGLPPMHVFTGSHDIIVTDSRQLVDRVRAAGGRIDYAEAPGMQHVYPILPLLGEARSTKRKVAKLLGQGQGSTR